LGDTTNAEPAAYLTTDEEPHPPSGVFELGTEVAGDLGDPRAAGVGGDAEEVHDASLDLDHETT
jgi:hypothetical protein